MQKYEGWSHLSRHLVKKFFVSVLASVDSEENTTNRMLIVLFLDVKNGFLKRRPASDFDKNGYPEFSKKIFLQKFLSYIFFLFYL
jgi:hypothetical protein